MLINSPHPACTVYPLESTPSQSIIAYVLLVSLRYDNVYSIFPLQGLYFLIYTVLRPNPKIHPLYFWRN